MPAPTPYTRDLVFGELLSHLRRQGFRVGVGHHFRLQELLNRCGPSVAPQDLKTILCPVFATNRSEQEAFYRAFDQLFPLFLVAPPYPPPDLGHESAATQLSSSVGAAARGNLRKLLYLSGTVLSAVIAVAVWAHWTSASRDGDELTAPSQGETQTVAMPQPAAPSATKDGAVQPTAAQVETPSTLPPPPPTPLSSESFSQRVFQFVTLHRIYILVPLIFFLVYEWQRYRHRKLILQKQHGKKPPYVWPVRIETFAPKLYNQEVFYNAAREMRRRQAAEHTQLDVDATIRATVESLGHPTLRYRLSTRPPEYLVLIERAGFRDHQARFFNELAKALESEGLFVARYFFEGDPRVCCDESGGCLSLGELLGRFSRHRLIVFGDGESLLDPVTGEPASWTTLLAEWRERALLTPRDTARWGLREVSLAGLFTVLPATLEGLLTLVSRFESINAGEVRVRQRGERLPNFFEGDAPAVVEEVRTYLGGATFQWLCACAVYPELHWDLTLYIGSLPSMGPGLICEDNLLRLTGLPWFRVGSIPDGVRWLLICELEREKEWAVRAAIVELLEKSPPPAETYAADVYQLNLVVQRWLSRPNRGRRREAAKALKAVPRNRVARDYTVMRYLEAAPDSALSLLLPARLRHLFYRDGIPAFGIKTGARLLFAAALTAAGLAAHEIGPAFWQPNRQIEARLERVITQNNIFAPPGESAYDLYRQLKDGGADASSLKRFEDRLWPLLTERPLMMLEEFSQPGSVDPPLGQWEESYKLLSWASELRPDDGPVAARARYCEGRIAYLNGRSNEALALWKKASDLDKTWALPTNAIGIIYVERRDYVTARTYLFEAVRRDPDWATPYNNLGTSYYLLKDYDEAEAHYRKAVARAPNWARPHAWLGEIALQRRDYDRAVSEYEAVLAPSAVGTARMDLDRIRERLERARTLGLIQRSYREVKPVSRSSNARIKATID